ncbi:MAG: hypothetical protein E6I69_03805 [Chloroflexi bacterium]|nr:MAG: hypothetical protein E6I69_03805 [Chloroflexota bacterium]TME92995.1 MAG: hypothetical protein E6I34_06935 [Chloroflexota bacterium]
MRFTVEMGSLLALAVVLLIVFVATRSAFRYRRELAVADAEVEDSIDVRSLATGAVAGAVVLVLLAVLYLGLTRWSWVGHPVPHHNRTFSSAPASTPTQP